MTIGSRTPSEHMPGGLRGRLRIPRSEAARGRRSEAVRAADPGASKKKKFSAEAAWREARALICARKGRLGARPGADAGQPSRRPRPAGDVQVPHRRRHRQGPRRPAHAAGAGRRRGDHHPGGDVLRAVAGPGRRGAAGDHRHAAAHRGARRAPARALLRLDAGRRAHLADHVGRRRHPQPRRHRPGPAHRQPGHRRRSPSASCSI